MAQPLRPTQTWSISASASYGGLTGFAVSVIHQIYSSFSKQVPDNVYTQIVGASLIGSVSGAILFAIVASLRNWLKMQD
jgi:hypothetical protein